MKLDDLSALKDDMTAFTEGHGMRRFHGYIPDEMETVLWDGDDNPEGWKDFVELAKAAGAPFLTMSALTFSREDADELVRRLERSSYVQEDDMEEAQWLRSFVGKTGFVQLGFPFQCVMFICEIACEWYDHYRRLTDLVEDFGSIAIDESDEDER